ncbi:MAG: hypothetical protein HOP04_04990 [Methylophilaceae bacterium]|nr:hypothetical protein [Methylophilaceae bacterium]
MSLFWQHLATDCIEHQPLIQKNADNEKRCHALFQFAQAAIMIADMGRP